MSEHVQMARLADGELGENRMFRIGYYGHGDIRMATWQGEELVDPVTREGNVQNFGMAHGSDVLIMASFAGFYKRLGHGEEEIRETLRQAGKDIIDDSQEEFFTSRWEYITQGEPSTAWDIPEHGLDCLVTPIPSQPGILEQTGGTGIYTRGIEQGVGRLVFGRFSRTESGEVALTDTADFCEADVPVMARLVCDVAVGEYQRDIQAFLNQLYRPDVD